MYETRTTIGFTHHPYQEQRLLLAEFQTNLEMDLYGVYLGVYLGEYLLTRLHDTKESALKEYYDDTVQEFDDYEEAKDYFNHISWYDEECRKILLGYLESEVE